jgi:hypothetical protein
MRSKQLTVTAFAGTLGIRTTKESLASDLRGLACRGLAALLPWVLSRCNELNGDEEKRKLSNSHDAEFIKITCGVEWIAGPPA